MKNVEIVHWNPKRRFSGTGLLSKMPIKRHINNFGDLLGPALVERILAGNGQSNQSLSARRLLTIGSILHFAQEGDVIWGSGVNGKSLGEEYSFKSLDVRSVRGPLTRDFLMQRGISVPEIYGDPGVLTARYFPASSLPAPKRATSYSVVPNLHDRSIYSHLPRYINPVMPLEECLAEIANSDLVIGSSLHGIITAESYGIPARLITSTTEPRFKYEDYYRGTGRSDFKMASSIEEAIELGGERLPDIDLDDLISAFPFDLWPEILC